VQAKAQNDWGVQMDALKVKIFNENTTSISPSNEYRINQWLRSHPDIQIVSMLQSEAMVLNNDDAIEKNLSITIFYK
jgi:hypothetical protein